MAAVDLAKKTGVGELLTATPSEVADTVFSNDDVEILTTELLAKLEALTVSVYLTQTAYNNIAIIDPDIEYKIIPGI